PTPSLPPQPTFPSPTPTPLSTLLLSNPTACTSNYPLSLHDALPISSPAPDPPSCSPSSSPYHCRSCDPDQPSPRSPTPYSRDSSDRKSTRLNSSHVATP